MKKVIKEEILPDIKGALFGNFGNANEALAEIIDNSVAHRVSDNQMIIKVFIIPSSKKIEIIDRGGEGMNLEALNDFFQWGKQKSRTRQDIGKYGQGGKAAIGYLGKAFQINTSPINETIEYEIKDSNFHDLALKEYSVDEKRALHDEGYTKLVIEKVHVPLTANFKEKFADMVSRYYKPLLADKSVLVYLDSEEIDPKEFPLDPNFKVQEFKFNVTDNINVTSIKGWVGRQVGGRSGIKGGMRLYYKGRLISEKEYFSHPDPTKKQTLNYLIGEVYIDDVIHPNMNKTDFNKSTDAWRMLQQRMDEILKPHVDELYGRTVDEPTEEEMDSIKKTKITANEIMRLMKDNNLLEGVDFDMGVKPSEHASESIQKTSSAKMTKRTNQPRTPAPQDAVGRRKRLNNFMDWDLRNMGESIRSVVEPAQASGNKKAKLLVINKDFPGYIRSKGNELYLLETFALQTVPVDSEDMPYKKFLDEFDKFYGTMCSFIDEAKENMLKKRK